MPRPHGLQTSPPSLRSFRFLTLLFWFLQQLGLWRHPSWCGFIVAVRVGLMLYVCVAGIEVVCCCDSCSWVERVLAHPSFLWWLNGFDFKVLCCAISKPTHIGACNEYNYGAKSFQMVWAHSKQLLFIKWVAKSIETNFCLMVFRYKAI